MSLLWCKITAISLKQQINSFQFLVILDVRYVKNVANSNVAYLLHFMQGVNFQFVAAKTKRFSAVENATPFIWIKL